VGQGLADSARSTLSLDEVSGLEPVTVEEVEYVLVDVGSCGFHNVVGERVPADQEEGVNQKVDRRRARKVAVQGSGL
jgi:hypothetical protein